MRKLIMKAAAQRASGDAPSPPRAALAASAAGVATAVLTYRVLRS